MSVACSINTARLRRVTGCVGIILLAVSWIFLVPRSARARLIELEDFSWGLPLLEVERRAEDHGFTLRAKDISQPELRLEYRARLYANDCLLAFAFTPLTGKLYAVTITWDSLDLGTSLRQGLIKVYGAPREEIPGAGISIWTRRNTELSLRAGRHRTTLAYYQILLRREAREEKLILREKVTAR